MLPLRIVLQMLIGPSLTILTESFSKSWFMVGVTKALYQESCCYEVMLL